MFRAYGASNLRNFVHVGVVVGGRGSLRSGGGGGSSAVRLVASEVVLHLGVQLLGGLGLGLSSASSLLLVGACLRSASGTVSSTLCSLRSGTLGLLLCGGLGLAVTMSVLAPSVSLRDQTHAMRSPRLLAMAAAGTFLAPTTTSICVSSAQEQAISHSRAKRTFIARLSTLTPFSSCAA